MESILSAVLVFVDVSPYASASRFEFLESHCESSWAQPLRVELGVCVCFEDKLARCVKLPCDEELLLARFGSNFCLIHFFSPPFANSFLLPIVCLRRHSEHRNVWSFFEPSLQVPTSPRG